MHSRLLIGLLFGTAMLGIAQAAPRHCKAYVFCGQSNMGGSGGRGDLDPHMQNQTDVWFEASSPGDTAPTNWIALGTLGGFGPEASAGRILADGLPTQQIAIVKVSAPATGLGYWRTPGQGGFIALTNRIDNARKRLQQQVDNDEISSFEFAGFMWMQGENEADGARGPAEAYFDNFTSFVSDVRDIIGVSNLPIVLGRISWKLDPIEYGGPVVHEHLILVRSNQVRFAEVDPYGEWVDTDDFGLVDAFHFNSLGQIKLGKRMGHAWLSLMQAEPVVTLEQAGEQSDPTNDRVIEFVAEFDQPVTGFDGSDITIAGTANATTAVVWEVAPYSGTTYRVGVAGMTNNGSVMVTIPAHAAVAMSGGLGNLVSISEDNVVDYGVESTVVDLLSHDDFNAPLGNLNGTRSGFGWRNNGWNVQNSAAYLVTDTSPLTYMNLIANAPHGEGGAVYNSSGRELDRYGTFDDYRDLNDRVHLHVTNTDIWVSFLVRRQNGSARSRVYICRDSVTWTASNPVILMDATPGNWQMSVLGGESVTSSVPATVDQTHLMVLHIAFGADGTNTVKWCIDPASLGGAAPAADYTFTTADPEFKFNRLHWYPHSQPAGASLDEIRFGRTYASVTPTWPADSVPEIVSEPLTTGSIGRAYGHVLRAAGGNGPLNWSVVSGSVPAGMELSSVGVLKGTPGVAGSSVVSVQAMDGDGDADTNMFEVVIVPEGGGVAAVILLALLRRRMK